MRYAFKGRHVLPAVCVLSAALLAALLLFLALRPLPPQTPAEGEAEVYFIDVGQGDCTLIRTHDAAVLIDAGPNRCEADLLAFLDSVGVDSLTCAVFTHPHEDHIGSADAVLDRLTVGTVVMPKVGEPDASAAVFRRLTDRIGAETRLLTVTDETVLSFDCLTLTLMCDAGGTENAAGNEVSLVIRASVGDCAVLIMGDAESDTEERLLARYAGTDTLSADVLRVGHHGSDTSTTPALLDAVNPAFAVISAGAGNSYGHPTGRVLSRLTGRGISILRTDTEGTVILHTNGREFFRIPR